MFAARDRGALIFEAFANSPPWFMTISGKPRYDLCMYVCVFTVLGIWKVSSGVVTGHAKLCSHSE